MTLIKFQKPQTALSRNNTRINSFSPILDTFFDDFFGGMTSNVNSLVPAVNISENNDNYKVEMAAPGLKKDNFRINLDGKVLTVSAETTQENKSENTNYALREFGYSNFSRSFNLPELVDFDKISAEYKDGILYLSIPKREEAKLKTREIKIA